jgi:hypothetical protein
LNQQWDPWVDARTLADRLRRPASKLIVVIGAEAWCERCRQFRPMFERWSTQAKESETWLWLDLEEHAEFLQGYVPDDLPQLLVYEAAQLACQRTVLPSETDPDALLSPPLAAKPFVDPGILATLTRRDWAS